MNELATVIEQIGEQLRNSLLSIAMYLPTLALAVLALLFGWFLARALRLLLTRTTSGLDRFWQYLVIRLNLAQLRTGHTPTRLLGEFVYWLVIAIFILLAADILGLAFFKTWVTQIFAFLPLLVGAVLLVFLGFLLSILARDLVIAAADSAGLPQGLAIGRAVQAVILIIAVITGVDQLGFDIAFLSVIVGISLAAVLGSIGLAFGLGARQHVRNLLAANHLRELLQIGDVVRIGNIEGRIADIGAAQITLESGDDLIFIPASLFDEQATVVVRTGAGDAG